MPPPPPHPAPSVQVPTDYNSSYEEREEGHYDDVGTQSVEGRAGSPVAPLDTTLSLALLVELKRVRRECAAMAGKLDRVAKRQKLTQGQLDTKAITTSPFSSPSSCTSSSTSPSFPPPPRLADWLKGVRLSTATSDHIHVRILSSRPSSNLLSCLGDQPWLIERVVPLSELRLPKHHFPPGIEPYLSAGLRPGQKVPATLVTGFNDQCCTLFKYSRVRGPTSCVVTGMLEMMAVRLMWVLYV